MERLEKLKALEQRLEEQLEIADAKSFAPLAKQYRETLAEIERIEGDGDNGDEIAEILGKRELAGKSGAVRKTRS